METNGTQSGSMSEEVVDRYFSVKITEATHNGDDSLLKFLEASLRLWNEKRSLHVQLTRNITAWHEETVRMNSLVETGQLYVPKGTFRQVTQRMVRHQATPSAEVLVMFVLMTVLLSYTLFRALAEHRADCWIAAVISAVAWGYMTRHITVAHKENS
jgi:hypothetical protein